MEEAFRDAPIENPYGSGFGAGVDRYVRQMERSEAEERRKEEERQRQIEAQRRAAERFRNARTTEENVEKRKEATEIGATRYLLKDPEGRVTYGLREDQLAQLKQEAEAKKREETEKESKKWRMEGLKGEVSAYKDNTLTDEKREKLQKDIADRELRLTQSKTYLDAGELTPKEYEQQTQITRNEIAELKGRMDLDNLSRAEIEKREREITEIDQFLKGRPPETIEPKLDDPQERADYLSNYNAMLKQRGARMVEYKKGAEQSFAEYEAKKKLLDEQYDSWLQTEGVTPEQFKEAEATYAKSLNEISRRHIQNIFDLDKKFDEIEDADKKLQLMKPYALKAEAAQKIWNDKTVEEAQKVIDDQRASWIKGVEDFANVAKSAKAKKLGGEIVKAMRDIPLADTDEEAMKNLKDLDDRISQMHRLEHFDRLRRTALSIQLQEKMLESTGGNPELLQKMSKYGWRKWTRKIQVQQKGDSPTYTIWEFPWHSDGRTGADDLSEGTLLGALKGGLKSTAEKVAVNIVPAIVPGEQRAPVFAVEKFQKEHNLSDEEVESYLYDIVNRTKEWDKKEMTRVQSNGEVLFNPSVNLLDENEYRRAIESSKAEKHMKDYLLNSEKMEQYKRIYADRMAHEMTKASRLIVGMPDPLEFSKTYKDGKQPMVEVMSAYMKEYGPGNEPLWADIQQKNPALQMGLSLAISAGKGMQIITGLMAIAGSSDARDFSQDLQKQIDLVREMRDVTTDKIPILTDTLNVVGEEAIPILMTLPAAGGGAYGGKVATRALIRAGLMDEGSKIAQLIIKQSAVLGVSLGSGVQSMALSWGQYYNEAYQSKLQELGVKELTEEQKVELAESVKGRAMMSGLLTAAITHVTGAQMESKLLTKILAGGPTKHTVRDFLREVAREGGQALTNPQALGKLKSAILEIAKTVGVEMTEEGVDELLQSLSDPNMSMADALANAKQGAKAGLILSAATAIHSSATSSGIRSTNAGDPMAVVNALKDAFGKDSGLPEKSEEAAAKVEDIMTNVLRLRVNENPQVEVARIQAALQMDSKLTGMENDARADLESATATKDEIAAESAKQHLISINRARGVIKIANGAKVSDLNYSERAAVGENLADGAPTIEEVNGEVVITDSAIREASKLAPDAVQKLVGKSEGQRRLEISRKQEEADQAGAKAKGGAPMESAPAPAATTDASPEATPQATQQVATVATTSAEADAGIPTPAGAAPATITSSAAAASNIPAPEGATQTATPAGQAATTSTTAPQMGAAPAKQAGAAPAPAKAAEGQKGAPQAAEAPQRFTKADGRGYKRPTDLKNQLKRKGLNPEDYDIVQDADGNHIALRKEGTPAAQPAGVEATAPIPGTPQQAAPSGGKPIYRVRLRDGAGKIRTVEVQAGSREGALDAAVGEAKNGETVVASSTELVNAPSQPAPTTQTQEAPAAQQAAPEAQATPEAAPQAATRDQEGGEPALTPKAAEATKNAAAALEEAFPSVSEDSDENPLPEGKNWAVNPENGGLVLRRGMSKAEATKATAEALVESAVGKTVDESGAATLFAMMPKAIQNYVYKKFVRENGRPPSQTEAARFMLKAMMTDKVIGASIKRHASKGDRKFLSTVLSYLRGFLTKLRSMIDKSTGPLKSELRRYENFIIGVMKETTSEEALAAAGIALPTSRISNRADATLPSNITKTANGAYEVQTPNGTVLAKSRDEALKINATKFERRFEQQMKDAMALALKMGSVTQDEIEAGLELIKRKMKNMADRTGVSREVVFKMTSVMQVNGEMVTALKTLADSLKGKADAIKETEANAEWNRFVNMARTWDVDANKTINKRSVAEPIRRALLAFKTGTLFAAEAAKGNPHAIAAMRAAHLRFLERFGSTKGQLLAEDARRIEQESIPEREAVLAEIAALAAEEAIVGQPRTGGIPSAIYKPLLKRLADIDKKVDDAYSRVAKRYNREARSKDIKVGGVAAPVRVQGGPDEVVMGFTQTADVSTMIHEATHALQYLKDPDTGESLLKVALGGDLQALNRWVKKVYPNAKEDSREWLEALAEGMEQFLAEGGLTNEAENEGRAFSKVAMGAKQILENQGYTMPGYKLNSESRKILDSLFSSTPIQGTARHAFIGRMDQLRQGIMKNFVKVDDDTLIVPLPNGDKQKGFKLRMLADRVVATMSNRFNGQLVTQKVGDRYYAVLKREGAAADTNAAFRNNVFRMQGVATPSTINDSSRIGTAKLGTSKVPVETTQNDNIEYSAAVEIAAEKHFNTIKDSGQYDHLPASIKRIKNPKRFIEKMVNWMTDNLISLYDAFPEEFRERATHWYDGANRLARRFAKEYGVSNEQVAGVMAALSPQKDWFMNVAQAKQVLDIYTNHKDTKLSGDRVMAEIEDIINAAQAPNRQLKGKTKAQKDEMNAQARADRRATIEPLIGKSINELPSTEAKGWAVRILAQAIHGRSYNVITPEGGIGEVATNNDAKRTISKNGWGAVAEIENAMSIIDDGSLANISSGLGDKHKVRSFYNNIIAPRSPFGDLTNDTHAVAAAHLMPFGASAAPVKHNFSGGFPAQGINGTYYIYKEAYVRAARILSERTGIEYLPRQIQSITWEAIRLLYPDHSRRGKAKKEIIDANKKLWKGDPDDARKSILSRGIPAPSWGRTFDSGRADQEQAVLREEAGPGTDAGRGLLAGDRAAAGGGGGGGGGGGITTFQSQGGSVRVVEPRGDRGRRQEGRSLAPLEGAPRVEGAEGPDAGIVSVAEQYAAENGIDLKRQSEYVHIDVDRATRIAQAYEAMEHAPNDPVVREAYENLIAQTEAQYRALEKAGYEFYFGDPNDSDYFGSPYTAIRELRTAKKMGVYPTTLDAFGDDSSAVLDNPLLQETSIKWRTPDGSMKPVLANDLFRAVHDAFGHSMEGSGFRARGEENAWQAHVRLFTGSAVAAITSETRGQNSWLNYGPHGEKNRSAKVEDTIFAEQKTGLMPEWTWTEGRAGDMESAPAAFQQQGGRTLATAQDVRDHIDNKFGKAIKEIGVPYMVRKFGYDAYLNIDKQGAQIFFNSENLAGQTEDQIDATVREEMIHAASYQVLKQKGINYGAWHQDLWRKMVDEGIATPFTKELYKSADSQIEAAAEFKRAAIQKILYGTVTEAEMRGKAFQKVSKLLKQVVDFFSKKLEGMKSTARNPQERFSGADTKQVFEETVAMIRKAEQKAGNVADVAAPTFQTKGIAPNDFTSYRYRTENVGGETAHIVTVRNDKTGKLEDRSFDSKGEAQALMDSLDEMAKTPADNELRKFFEDTREIISGAPTLQSQGRTIFLNRKGRGVYERKVGDITIQVSNPRLSFYDIQAKNEWQLLISDEKDPNRNIFSDWFRTKKEAYDAATNWVLGQMEAEAQAPPTMQSQSNSNAWKSMKSKGLLETKKPFKFTAENENTPFYELGEEFFAHAKPQNGKYVKLTDANSGSLNDYFSFLYTNTNGQTFGLNWEAEDDGWLVTPLNDKGAPSGKFEQRLWTGAKTTKEYFISDMVDVDTLAQELNEYREGDEKVSFQTQENQEAAERARQRTTKTSEEAKAAKWEQRDARDTQGKKLVQGDPTRANISPDQSIRNAMDVHHEIYNENFQQQSWNQWVAEANKLQSTMSVADIEAEIFKAAEGLSNIAGSAGFQILAKRIVGDRLQQAMTSGNQADIDYAQGLAQAHLETKGEIGRSLNAMQDPFQNPMQRNAYALGNMILTAPPGQIQALKKKHGFDNGQRPSKEQKAAYDADLKKLQKARIKDATKALADKGVDIKEIFNAQKEGIAINTKADNDAMQGLTDKQRAVVNMTREGATPKDVQNATGVSEGGQKVAMEKFKQSVTKQAEKLVDAGYTAETMDAYARGQAPPAGAKKPADRAAAVEEIVNRSFVASGKPKKGFNVNNPYHVQSAAQAIDEIDMDWVTRSVGTWYANVFSMKTIMINALSMPFSGYRTFIERGAESAINSIVKNPAAAQWGEYEYIADGMRTYTKVAMHRAMIAYDTERAGFHNFVKGRTEAETMAGETHEDVRGYQMGHLADYIDMAIKKAMGGKDIMLPHVGKRVFGRKGAKTAIKLGTSARTILKANMAVDEFMRYMTAGAEVGAIAYRIGVANGLKGDELKKFITREMTVEGSQSWIQAGEEADISTFTADLPTSTKGDILGPSKMIGFIMNAVDTTMKKKDKSLKAEKYVARETEEGFNRLTAIAKLDAQRAALSLVRVSLLPFTRVLMNLMTQGYKRVPNPLAFGYALTRLGVYMIKNPVDKQTGFRKSDPNMDRYSQIAGRQLITHILAWALWGAMEGDEDDEKKETLGIPFLITGSMPKFGEGSKAEKELAYRKGLGPYRIKIGNFTFDYGRIDPLAVTLGTTVDFARAIKRSGRGEQTYDAAGVSLAFDTIAGQMTDKTMLRGMNDIFTIASGKMSGSSWLARNLATMVVPNMIRQPMRDTNEFLEARVDSGGLKGFMEMLAWEAWPNAEGVTKNPFYAPPADRDAYGNKVKRPSGPVLAFPLTWIFRPQEYKTNMLDRMVEADRRMGLDVAIPTKTSNEMTFTHPYTGKKTKVSFTPYQYEVFQRNFRQAMKLEQTKVMQGADVQKAKDRARTLAIEMAMANDPQFLKDTIKSAAKKNK